MKKLIPLSFFVICILMISSYPSGSIAAGTPISPTSIPTQDSDEISPRAYNTSQFRGTHLDELAPNGEVIGLETPQESITIPQEPDLGSYTISSVAAGLSYSCAVTSQGTVRCWGDNVWGQLGDSTTVNRLTPVDVVDLADVESISAFHKHICALTSAGGVKCWGRNYHGELGDGTIDNRSRPVDVIGLADGVRQVSAGGFHTCAVLDNDELKCWGVNWHGQLGDGKLGNTELAPADSVALGETKVQAVATGKWHTCVLTTVGGVKCFGYNLQGQAGNGQAIMDNPEASDVIGLSSGVKALALGEIHSCALMLDGKVKCWGDNTQGQLGDGSSEIRQVMPVDVSGLSNVIAITAGSYHTCALLEDGQVRCWGDNWAGQVGDGTNVAHNTPVTITGLPLDAVDITAGDSHTCAVLINGRAMCWGANSFGQVGKGTSAMHMQAGVPVGMTSGIHEIAAGLLHTCVLTDEGAVKCWGQNDFGQLGDGTMTDHLTPVDVVGLQSGVTAISAGYFHTCALVDHTARCWGYNRDGQLGDSTRETRLTPVRVQGINYNPTTIATGAEHTCVTVDGQVMCWGNNDAGQLGNESFSTKDEPVLVHNLGGLWMEKVVAGEDHTCAYSSQGALKCWGYNFYGQLGNVNADRWNKPSTVEGISGGLTALTAGRGHTCAVVDGGAWCWGFNANGQVGNGSLTNQSYPQPVSGLSSGVVDIRAGGLFTCALLEDGTLKCWGDNWQGELGDGTTYSRYVPVDSLAAGFGNIGLAMGDVHACVLTSSGGVKCWGSNHGGQIGDGIPPWESAPVLVKDLVKTNLIINHTSGKPGSYFAVNGDNFLPGHVVNVIINGHVLSTTFTTDGEGLLNFQLTSEQADLGLYRVLVRADVEHTFSLNLAADAPLHSPEGIGPEIAIPPGIALDNWVYLPFTIH